ncbi:MAG: Helix-turn-helix domain, partial [Pseudomonadota bacterium]
ADIARELGFASPAYFATAFRRATGHAPAAFRKAQARLLVG